MGGEADGVSWTRELMTYRLYDDDCGCAHVSMLSLLRQDSVAMSVVLCFKVWAAC
jgi:hypothetical protein